MGSKLIAKVIFWDRKEKKIKYILKKQGKVVKVVKTVKEYGRS